jgi:hypothetical protein
MFKYDIYITNSLIITKYINKTYQHENKCLLLTARFRKGGFNDYSIKRLCFIGNPHRTSYSYASVVGS